MRKSVLFLSMLLLFYQSSYSEPLPHGGQIPKKRAVLYIIYFNYAGGFQSDLSVSIDKQKTIKMSPGTYTFHYITLGEQVISFSEECNEQSLSLLVKEKKEYFVECHRNKASILAPFDGESKIKHNELNYVEEP